MGKRTKQDPTGQSSTRTRATRRLQTRVSTAESRVKQLVREVPRTRRREAVIRNQVSIPVYDYQITATELEILQLAIRGVIADELLETQFNRMPPNWWWQSIIERPYRAGTAEEIVQFNRLITAELVRTRTQLGVVTQRLEVSQVLQSTEYLTALDDVYVKNFSTIRQLSDRTADQVIQRVNAGISAGETPTAIAESISGRFDVSRSSAKRIADTEVNRAYNDARLNATDVAASHTGLRAGVLHLSALTSTTRSEHGGRHGDAFTTAQQRLWWDSGSNRINCLCSTRSVLIDRNSKVIDVELQEEIQVEREFFDVNV